jgi:aspartate 1-decarboxylase
MKRLMLKSKIHRATVTGTEIDYEGSIAIDQDLLEAADILPGEQVHVLNLTNNQRLVTYAITAPKGSGTVMLNGPAARACVPGDLIIILTYCELEDEEAKRWQPTIILVNEKNRPQ